MTTKDYSIVWKVLEDHKELFQKKCRQACKGDKQYYEDMYQELYVLAAEQYDKLEGETTEEALADYLYKTLFNRRGPLSTAYHRMSEVIYRPNQSEAGRARDYSDVAMEQWNNAGDVGPLPDNM